MFAKWQSLHCGVFVCETQTYFEVQYTYQSLSCVVFVLEFEMYFNTQYVLIPNLDICTCISEALWSTVKLCCAVLRGRAGRPARSAPQWPQHFMCSLSGHQGNNNHDDHDDDIVYIMMKFVSVCSSVTKNNHFPERHQDDGRRKSHLRKAHQVGLSEVGLPEGNLWNVFWDPSTSFWQLVT